MSKLKEEALKSLSELPEETTLEEMMYRLYVLENIQHGEEEEAAGRMLTHKELGRRMREW